MLIVLTRVNRGLKKPSSCTRGRSFKDLPTYSVRAPAKKILGGICVVMMTS